MKTVLICGAGPTGLALALWLTKAGIPVRVIDAAAKPGTTSRATVVHARTLELYHQMGIERGVIESGIEFKSGRLWVNGSQVARLSFGEGGVGLSPYPYTIIFPQDKHEAYLEQVLLSLGVKVERSTTLLSFEETESGISAQIRPASGITETLEAAYLAGCDGAHSVVRHSIGTGFPGGSYQDLFYVADLRISGPLDNSEMNIALDDADFLVVFPMQDKGNVRLVGAVKQSAKNKEHLQWADVSDSIILRLKMNVEEVRWFSTYHVHHRVADTFRKGRAFLLGDAGHIHSPVGGQGMNTGIGDALNLAWKLAAVLNGAPETLLDTYAPERMAFAQKLVATTDSAFTFVAKRSALATFIRTHLVPPLLRLLFKFNAVRRAAFLALSQTRIHYRQSALSEGKAGRIRGGDRLPWLPLNGGSGNFLPLAQRCWQVHHYGDADAGLSAFCKEQGVPLLVFPAGKTGSKTTIGYGATFVVRPDGYIGLALAQADTAKILSYCERWGIGAR